MNKLLVCVLCVVALFAAVVPCLADTVNGVLAEERVVKLPNDQGKWYISVVGNANDARYNEILGWFDSNPSLAKLKDQVQFCPVASNTAIYKERYSATSRGCPPCGCRSPTARWSTRRRERNSHDGGGAERCLGGSGQRGPRAATHPAVAARCGQPLE